MSVRFDWENTSIEQLREVSDDVEKNPFKYLHVDENDPVDHIKRMYRILAKKYHPDIHGVFQRENLVLAYEKMVQINRAFDAIQRIKGTKAEWEAAHYDLWKKDESNFEGFPGKEVINLESFQGELYRQTGMDLPERLVPGVLKKEEAIFIDNELGKRYYHSHSMIRLAFGEPDESFEFGFGQCVSLMQLFTYLARKQGISVAPVVVKPLLEFYNLHEAIDAKEFADVVTQVPVSGEGLNEIIKRFGISDILKSRPNSPKIEDFMYDLSRIVDMTQFWSEDSHELERYFVYGAGIKEDGGLVIYHGWQGMESSEFTKNDFELMVRVTYGDNLLPFVKGDKNTATYDVQKFGSEEARLDAIRTFREQNSRDLERDLKRLNIQT
jgi:hypothetical protein